ncbi:MAG: hypothetical protein BGO78_04425 [Chloroflexi bacterium 44-23]|nr:MAG: hypothetical protein BGO78_04425 [Chloroflexi bacterium 44-23]
MNEQTDDNAINQIDGQGVPKKLKPRRGIWYMLGIFLILIGAGAGYFFGAAEAMSNRTAEEEKAVIDIATTQFQLGIREFEEKRFENARKRFEYVIQIYPDFPGAQEKLTEVLFAQANVATPTPIPSPTPRPTADMRGEEEIFGKIQSSAQSEDWDGVIASIDALRTLNINYEAVAVDGYYYLALRNRGVNEILAKGNLEPGIYDLTLAERFGPLDDEAKNYRTWARFYISGASFWGVDWSRVVQAFGQIYPSLPNLRDSSGMTAQERYRMGLIKWGDQLALEEDWCGAYEKYDMAFAFGVDEMVAPTATHVYEECNRPEETEAPPATQTPTPSPTTPGDSTSTPGGGGPEVSPTIQATLTP